MRTIIGFFLSIVVILCLYYEYLFLLYALCNLASIYDSYYLYFNHKLKWNIVLAFSIITCAIHTIMYYQYIQDPLSIIKIISITQTSDIYQYLSGKYYGYHKIGWISKNKTFEGYILGYGATILTFIPIYIYITSNTIYQIFHEVSLIFILGVLGGLFSSMIKRIVRIKDYSNLLGPHGGWMDRIDSLTINTLKLLI